MKRVPRHAALFLVLPLLGCQGAGAMDPAAEGPPARDPASIDAAAVEAALRASMGNGSFCTRTANLLFAACAHGVIDDLFVAFARCVNVASAAERTGCLAEAREAREDARTLCRDQRGWRLDACSLTGQDRYDPVLDPARFDDPRQPLTSPNPFFPLAVGHRWELRGGAEVNTIEVVPEFKLIEGVTAFVARDLVSKGGDLAESTDDWFAMAKDGNVWYLGEEVKDFQSFDGDAPRRPELVSIDGSFKHGRERDKAGIIFQASPRAGLAYREEFSLANAEDVTEILSTSYAFGADADLDQFVPEGLAKIVCSARDCVVTRNISLLEPGVEARKYFARGIGFFLEVNPDTGELVQLTSCNVDPRCTSLPPP